MHYIALSINNWQQYQQSFIIINIVIGIIISLLVKNNIEIFQRVGASQNNNCGGALGHRDEDEDDVEEDKVGQKVNFAFIKLCVKTPLNEFSIGGCGTGTSAYQ